MGSSKSNKPCDFVSSNGELYPWHGTPGIVPVNRIEETPILEVKRPRTWEDVKVDADKSKIVLDNSTPFLLKVVTSTLTIASSPKLSNSFKGWPKIPTLVH